MIAVWEAMRCAWVMLKRKKAKDGQSYRNKVRRICRLTVRRDGVGGESWWN